MLLEVKDIIKSFYGVTALENINIRFEEGIVHALVGENGAGKSTLIKIIGGVYHADSGAILIDGMPVKIHSPFDALKKGISIVHQEYNLVRNMTVLENVMFGKEITGRFGKMDKAAASDYLQKIANKDNIKVDLGKYAGDLSSAEAKVVEILRACCNDMRLLILDEPTAALDDEDIASLFSLIRSLKTRGIGIIYISHRLDEVFQICDRVSVLKDGKHIGTWNTGDIDRDFLIKAMVGREIKDIFPHKASGNNYQNSVILSVRNLSDSSHFDNISFELKRGEILGIGGMSGHGQRELIRALFGAIRVTKGTIAINGEKVAIKHPAQAVKHGIAFLSDDRRNEGLAEQQSVARNIAYPSLKMHSRHGIIKSKAQHALIDDLIMQLNIKLSSQQEIVQNLSGGNQQRVVLAKWLPLKPCIMLFHEPTLGIDIGAKVEIYKILRNLVEQGISIIMVTSDMLELLNMSDRILVFYEGHIMAEYPGSVASEELIMAAASGKPFDIGDKE